MESVNDPLKLSGDAWLELQAFKNKQLNRRQKLNRHKELINGLGQLTDPVRSKATNSQDNSTNASFIASHQTPSTSSLSLQNSSTNSLNQQTIQHSSLHENKSTPSLSNDASKSSDKTNILSTTGNQGNHPTYLENSNIVECVLILKLCDVALKLPVNSKVLRNFICKIHGLEGTSQSLVKNLLQKFVHQELISIEEPSTALLDGRNLPHDDDDDELCIYVTSVDHTKLVELERSYASSESIRTQLNTANEDNVKNIGAKADDEIESLLSLSSTKERESRKLGEELLELLGKPTAKEKILMERFRSADGYQVQEFCPKGTKGECNRHNNGVGYCDKLHFKKIIAKHTEESLGDCSFLNTCFHMDSCKYVHYEVDYDDKPSMGSKFKRPKTIPSNKASIDANQAACSSNNLKTNTNTTNKAKDGNNNSSNNSETAATNQLKNQKEINKDDQGDDDIFDLDAQLARVEPCDHARRFKTVLYPPQWIQCDLRFFDMSLLGKFSVVMADPPWDIHMELPYGTMSDDEMRKLNIPALQDEGVIFLWVTGRAMELGRECLTLWGYERCDEVIWVKTNQLQRIIRTGRTGHWLNHGKEHCLVGVKGNPRNINRGLDCDVIVAEVRATSHKPDEIYGIIERLSPGTRKIELFGRPHNVQPNWITLGNQLNGVKLMDPDLVETFERLNLPHQSEVPLIL